MIRLILKHRECYSGVLTERFETLDIEAPSLEKALTAGGRSFETNSFEFWDVVGAEVVRPGECP